MRKKLLNHPLPRYVFVGGFSYLIELAVLLALHRILDFSVELSTAIAFWIGLIVSFVLQKQLAFRDYQRTMKSISGQVGKYGILVGFNYIFTLLVVSLFPSHLVIVSRTLALIIVTFWNYFLYKRFIFNQDLRKNKAGVRTVIASTISVLKSSELKIGVLLSLPILIFFWQYLATGNKIINGDFDYYAQQYEAFRISVLHFHQFPSWNPWLSGGIPLFVNPQFGLFSVQSVFVLLFGTIYGMKLAYVTYALLGFWGMYLVGRRMLNAGRMRSGLVGYIWVFNGFYAGHTISHFTFPLFFLTPWLFLFIAQRDKRYSWLGLGVLFALIINSSVHYAFLMLALVLVIYYVLSLIRIGFKKNVFQITFNLSRNDVLFALKAFAVVFILGGYRLLLTYHFETSNPRFTDIASEGPNSLGLIFKSLFLPIGTLIHHYPKTTWGWGEYSMYIGWSTGLALLVCLGTIIYLRFKTRTDLTNLMINRTFIACLLMIGFISVLLATGDWGPHSPFYLLHKLPGFTQTRVPSRWVIMTMFALLVVLMAWQRNKRLINTLLLISVVELFLSFGPPRIHGQEEISTPQSSFANTFSQYDNRKQHLDADQNIMHSYYYATSLNVGQIYADDSLINTLSASPPLLTSRCGINTSSSCNFVLSKNASVDYWSPNKIQLTRTEVGPIELNMNVDKGWRVNGAYPFISLGSLDPSTRFILTDSSPNYTLEYSPKGSPSWIRWKIARFFD